MELKDTTAFPELTRIVSGRQLWTLKKQKAGCKLQPAFCGTV